MKKESFIPRMRAIIETHEILRNKELMDNLREGIADAKEGKTIPWEKAKQLLRFVQAGG